jgi:hypothetical protein
MKDAAPRVSAALTQTAMEIPTLFLTTFFVLAPLTRTVSPRQKVEKPA